MQTILQSNRSDCGVACLVMLLNSHGAGLNYTEVINQFGSPANGASIEDLIGFSMALGAVGLDAYSIEEEDLKGIPTPFIAHWEFKHFVIVKRVSKNYVDIFDPAIGDMRETRLSFGKKFTGVALFFQEDPSFEVSDGRRRRSSFGDLVDPKSILKSASLPIILLLLVSSAIFIFPFYIRLLFELVTSTNFVESGSRLLAAFALLLLTFYLFQRQHVASQSRLISRIDGLASDTFLRKLLALPPKFFRQKSTPQIIAKSHALRQIRAAVVEHAPGVVVSAFLLALGIFLCVVINTSAGLVLAFGVAVIIALEIYSFFRLQSLERRRSLLQAEEHAWLLETFRNVATVKAFSKEAAVYQRWRSKHWKYTSAFQAAFHFSLQSQYRTDSMSNILLLIVTTLSFGQLLSLDNGLSLAIAFLFFAQLSLFNTRLVTSSLRLLVSALANQHFLDDVILTEPENRSDVSMPMKTGALQVCGGSYAYSTFDRMLFEDLNITIPDASFFVIKGKSGSGKTTLLNLLAGLDSFVSGEYYADGTRVTSLNAWNFRANIAYISQDVDLFGASVLENITLFDPQPDQSQLEIAVEFACLSEVLRKLPMGLNTVAINSISGGERQRILIARAIYSKKKIIFMDEATSALDAETERKINANLRSLLVTRVVVAHRKETIDLADLVYDMDSKTLVVKPF